MPPKRCTASAAIAFADSGLETSVPAKTARPPGPGHTPRRSLVPRLSRSRPCRRSGLECWAFVEITGAGGSHARRASDGAAGQGAVQRAERDAELADPL